MKEVVALSGKGGTGKTTLLASLAVLARNKVMADCDVDAANLHLLLDPDVGECKEFWGGQVADIDRPRCLECGLCEDVCRFNAINDFVVDPVACEGCGFCFHVCPEQAIVMKDNLAGHWFISETRYGPLVHARLGIAQENSGRLVTVVRHHARLLAEKRGLELILSDGPPGIGCPAISSLSGAELVLLVTEPTLSGIHDLERVLGVCRHFGAPVVVCINKCDLNESNSALIETTCSEQGIDQVTRIPFDNTVTEALANGVPVVEYSQNSVTDQIVALWESVRHVLHLQEGNRESRR